mmetsp:Transcript_6189/g.10271  ORF Transcript_6189/g.10271 Transcript_6189/m.10271 type:complete len:327 (-) Transcript_6189:181-1161(-)
MGSLAPATACPAGLPTSMMPLLRVARAGITRPFGDERTVKQAFPAGVSTEESDPFLMCDYFSSKSSGVATHPDDFPVGWHPHRGMDILSYMKSGRGRHGDSMGNRETFSTPGMQWISCGSGIEHAEGGGTPAGEVVTGFQIWINVPAERKMEDPMYGTEPAEAIPQEEVAPGVMARLMSGPWKEGLKSARTGAMKTQTATQMVDFELSGGAVAEHALPLSLDTALLYVYRGSGSVAGKEAPEGSVVVLDATAEAARGFAFEAGTAGAHFILFAGKKLKEPLAWRGPIVMNTQAQVRECLQELQAGAFPPKRVAWDYKRIGTKPLEK